MLAPRRIFNGLCGQYPFCGILGDTMHRMIRCLFLYFLSVLLGWMMLVIRLFMRMIVLHFFSPTDY